MRKYRVRIDYTDFIFDNGSEAVAFAETAVSHLVDDDKEVKITIYYEEESKNED